MSKPSIGSRLLMAAIGAALMAAPQAASGAVFTDPEQVSPPGDRASYPDLAIGPSGRSTVAWSGTPTPLESRTQARTIEPGGFQGPVFDISPPGAQAPIDIAGGDRDWIVAWARHGIEARRIGPEGTPGPLIRVAADGAGVESVRPKVAIGPGGTAFVAWRQFEPGGQRVGIAVIGPDGRIVKRLGLRRSLGVSAPHIEVGPDDLATVVWRRKYSARGHGGNRFVILAARIDERGSVERIGRISSRSGRNGDTRVATDERGRTFIVWRRFARRDSIQAARIGRAGGISGPHRLTRGGRGKRRPYYIDPAIATVPDGAPRAVWVRAGRRPGGRLWSSPLDHRARRDGRRQRVSDRGGDASEPEIAIDERGRTAVAWQDFSASTERIGAAVVNADGSVTGPELVSGDGGSAFSPALAISADQRALIAYWRSLGEGATIELVRGPG